MTEINNHINYVEFPLSDADATKKFFSSVFGWQFQDWGTDYLSFEEAGISGGFNREAEPSKPGIGVLAIMFAEDLDAKIEEVRNAGGEIVREIFEFPGGRRFHFLDPNQNEWAVWGSPVE